MASLIKQGAESQGAEVVCKQVSDASLEELSGFDVVALGSPSMGSEVVEESEMAPFADAAAPGLKGRKTALFGSYGWGDGEWMRNWTAAMKEAGVLLVDDGLIVHENPNGESAERCVALGAKLAS
jgi:flavodoxin short chain